jgi:N-acetylglucosamine kinase-like BadF-type ATPase
MTRSELAALAPIVSRAARAGDRQALCIIEMAAQELAAVVHAVRDQLGAPPQLPLPVSYSGGMFHQDIGLTQKLESILAKGERRYEFAAPRLAPRSGAALYAAKLSGSPLLPLALAQLTRTHGAAPLEGG